MPFFLGINFQEIFLVALHLAVAARLQADEMLAAAESAMEQLLEFIPLDGQIVIDGPLLHGLLEDAYALIVLGFVPPK